MSVTAKQILDVMRSWLGLSRSKGTHKPIIDIYNSFLPRARGYKVKYTDSYCDATVSAAFIKLGAVDAIGGTECGVEKHVEIFKKAGIWEENGRVKPEPGWIIVYNWDDTTQPNDGYSDHIGIVESVTSSGLITTIEGNINGGVVGRRTRQVGDGRIRGYAIPKYAVPSTVSKSTKASTVTVTLPVLKKGATGRPVQALQILLNGRGYNCGAVDGKFGPNTLAAVRKCQTAEKIAIDGSVGKETWSTLLT